MASDGLWNVVSPQEAADFVHFFCQDKLENGVEERRTNSMVATALIEKALCSGGIERVGVQTILVSL